MSNTPSKQQVIAAIQERVEGYESLEKSEFISELLATTDYYVLLNIAAHQQITVNNRFVTELDAMSASTEAMLGAPVTFEDDTP